MNALYISKAKQLVFTILFMVLSMISNGQDYELEKVTFNSPYADFAPIRYQKGVVFCSSRYKKKLSADTDSINFYTDLFRAQLKANNSWANPALFSQSLTEYLNEGPASFTRDEKTLYYTTNFAPKDSSRKDHVEEWTLGIQIARLENDVWKKTEPFLFNSPKSNYNVAHPALSKNDSVLYFASDMPGGFGGMDLYKCIWSNGTWSIPINLGSKINSKGNELFPYIGREGYLYFASNGWNQRRKDMDIYAVDLQKQENSEPTPLPEPINSSYDDFAYTEYASEEFGFISSNRDENKDAIYSFRLGVPNFNDCLENLQTVECFLFEETKVLSVDSLPLVYEWDLGDGTKRRGLSVEHCYEKMGNYHVQLNIIDTISHSTFFAVSSADIEVQHYEQPYILSNDTVMINDPIRLFTDNSKITQFEVEKMNWIIDNEKHYQGDSVTVQFSTPGWHQIIVGASSKLKPGGGRDKACAYKEIYVSADSLRGYPKSDPDPHRKPVMRIQPKSNIDAIASTLQADYIPLYHIIVKRSAGRIPFNDPAFAKIRFVIMESHDASGDYVYTVGNTSDLVGLYPIYQELSDSGFVDLNIEAFSQEKMNQEFMRTGTFIEPGNATKLNKEFINLRDIKFEYNSDVIREESKANLDYISSMLLLEEDFLVKINAHTCSLGKPDYNMDLSSRRAKSVERYFISRGIDPSRFISKGFAATEPIADNATEEGRANNRRVEFIIVFPVAQQE